jgi:hypothetical protein
MLKGVIDGIGAPVLAACRDRRRKMNDTAASGIVLRVL